VELGLGIHGEPGAETIAYQPMDALAELLTERLDLALGTDRAPIALLVNDLGGVPPIEMAVATRAILRATRRDVRLVFGPGRLMTSLDMKGLSVSALPLDASLEAALLAPVAPVAWAIGRHVHTVDPLPLPARLGKVAHPRSSDPARRHAVDAICAALIAAQDDLDALDAKVGDGDTGTTFATAARAIRADLDALPFADVAALCDSVAARLSVVMGGSSGILVAIAVSALGTAYAEASKDGRDWGAALQEAARRIQQYGGAAPGDRTMLDALVPAAAALASGEGVAAAARAAQTGVERTKGMRASAGRSSYVRHEALRGHADPGAAAVAAVFDALAALG
jgi:dihydroxyacetone kinase